MTQFEYRGELTREGKADFLRSIDINCVPSPYADPKGLYILESMAVGTPVASPAHGAFPELIEATGGGLISEQDDALSLADSIDRLLSDPIRARVMGIHGRTVVLERFTADAMAQRFAALCMQELQKRGLRERTGVR